jgi:hypothetical protein
MIYDGGVVVVRLVMWLGDYDMIDDGVLIVIGVVVIFGGGCMLVMKLGYG